MDASAGSGAPSTVDYLVKTADPGLSAELVVQNGTNTTFTTGAGTAQIDLVASPSVTSLTATQASPSVTTGAASTSTGGVKFFTSASSGSTTLTAGNPGAATDVTTTLPTVATTMPTAQPVANGYALTATTGGTQSYGILAVAAGGSGAAPGADDQLLVSDSTSAATWRTLTTCTGTGKAITYDTSTNAFGCNTISGGSGLSQSQVMAVSTARY